MIRRRRGPVKRWLLDERFSLVDMVIAGTIASALSEWLGHWDRVTPW